MEADLQQFYGVDYRDRWRKRDGRPVLTLRRLAVLLLRGLPEGSMVVTEHHGSRPWTRTEHLLDDLRMTLLAVNGVKPVEPHPARQQRRTTAQVDAALRSFEQRKRLRERRLKGAGR